MSICSKFYFSEAFLELVRALGNSSDLKKCSIGVLYHLDSDPEESVKDIR